MNIWHKEKLSLGICPGKLKKFWHHLTTLTFGQLWDWLDYVSWQCVIYSLSCWCWTIENHHILATGPHTSAGSYKLSLKSYFPIKNTLFHRSKASWSTKYLDIHASAHLQNYHVFFIPHILSSTKLVVRQPSVFYIAHRLEISTLILLSHICLIVYSDQSLTRATQAGNSHLEAIRQSHRLPVSTFSWRSAPA